MIDSSTSEGDVVIITGASRGIGKSMVLRFSQEGAFVVLVARSSDDLDAVAEVVERTHDVFVPLDTLINNAGIGLLSLANERRRLVDVTEDEWDAILSVNLKRVYLFLHEVLSEMVAREEGNIINVSSALGRQAVPRMAPYVASKFGLGGLARFVALKHEDHGVNINGLDPGGRVDAGFWDHLPEKRKMRCGTVM